MAFHPYPQLIPSVFNLSGFAPPRRLTVASHWPWVDHSASGLEHATTTALLGLAFATASPHGLTLPHTTNSQAHSSKGTLSPLRAPTACMRSVSGTISLPSRGTFHLSLTVLVRYRSRGSIQAYQVVLADSHRISRARCYSGTASRRTSISSTGVTPSTPSHSPRLRLPLHVHAELPADSSDTSHNPQPATPAGYHTDQV